MPKRKEHLVNDEIYHIVLRAIDDNLIFKDVNDYFRGIYSIYEFNNANPVNIFNRRRDRIIEKKYEKLCEVGSHTGSATGIDGRDKFVEVLAFCFMPNHIHLLVSQIKDGGISKFMQKVGGGYGRYFNDKHHRKGHVFQNTFGAVHIKDNSQFMVVAPYIFTNPVALVEPGWKEHGIKKHSVEEVIKFLEEYKWSSYGDCIGVKNFPSVTQRDFLLEVMGGEQGLEDAIDNWVGYKKDWGEHDDLFLE